MDGRLIQNVAYIQIVIAFIGEFDIQERAFLNVSVSSPTLTALSSLFEEISKIILRSRCPGDPRWTRTRHVTISMVESKVYSTFS